MLAPDARTVLLETLRPPDGFALGFGVATTFTLDLTAALVVPLAFARADSVTAEIRSQSWKPCGRASPEWLFSARPAASSFLSRQAIWSNSLTGWFTPCDARGQGICSTRRSGPSGSSPKVGTPDIGCS